MAEQLLGDCIVQFWCNVTTFGRLVFSVRLRAIHYWNTLPTELMGCTNIPIMIHVYILGCLLKSGKGQQMKISLRG